jgi:hypothetical protein
MDKPTPTEGGVFFTPLPHTPPVTKFLPSLDTLKRGLATVLATLVFYTQAVCAGTASLPLLSTTGTAGAVAKQTNLLERLMKLTGVTKKDAPYVFHENEFKDRMKLTDPGQDPETIKRQQEGAEARRDIENVNAKAKGMQFPELSRPGYLSPKEILAGIQIDALEKELTPGDLAMKTVNEVVENMKVKMKAVFGSATEFNFSVKKNFDGSYSRTYLVDGRASRVLNSKTRNPHGMAVTQNITNMRYNRSHILVSMDIAHKDVKGQTSYTTRRMSYHDGAKAMVQETQQVKEMWEDTITSQNEKKSLHRFEMNYDAKNNLTQYQERSVDENGRATDRKWWGGTYDDSKNLLNYEELTTEKGLDTHVKWVASGYEKNAHWNGRKAGESDQWGRSEYELTGYVKVTVGPDGLEQKDVTSNMAYNAFSNLMHYERMVTSWDGQATRIVWDGDYDQYDRAAAYRQITTDSFGHSRTLEFTEGEYTVDDDLIGYREKTTENGETIEKHFQNALYDTKHNLMDYFQTDTDSRGRVSAKHWTASGAGLGYKEGDLVGYMEVLSLGPLRVKTKMTGITYDALNRQNGGRETKRVTGIETDGVYTDVTVVTETVAGADVLQRSQRELNKELGYQMNVVELTGSQSVKTTHGTDNLTNQLVRQLKETTVRSEMTTHGDYREVKTLTGSWDGEELESVTDTRRTDVVLDGFGRAMSFVEETVRGQNPASWVKRTTGQVSYNLDGNLTTSYETTEDSLGVAGEVTRTNMFYDQQGRLEEYDLKSTNAAEGSMTGVTAHRNKIGYNGLGDVTTYDERQVKLGSTAVETLHWEGDYTVLGLVGNSNQVNHRVGEAVVGGVLRPLDVTETTATRGMKYTRDGASLRAYREEMASTASPDALQITTMAGGTYDAYDRLATYKQKVERVTAGAVRADGSIDGSKAVLHAITETERTSATFNSLGGVTGYTETLTQSEGSGQPAGGSVSHRQNMVFHPLGQLRSYDGDETRFESPDITTNIQWRGRFDLYMRSAGAVEHKRERLSTGAVGLETTTVRDNVGYDNLGQMVKYEETVERSDAANVVTTIVWENGVFDGMGNLEGYRETTQVRGRGISVGLANTKVLDRRGTSYDTHGLLTSYFETLTDSAQPAVEVTTERQSTVHDQMGRETGSVSMRHEAGQSQETTASGDVVESNLNKWTTVIQTGRRFNDVGLATDYREASFDGDTLSLAGGAGVAWSSLSESQRLGVLDGTLKADEAVTFTQRSGTLYDRHGLAESYTESTRELSTTLDHNRTTDRSGAVYNALHQLTGSTDRVGDDASPGVTETTVSSKGEYNGFGQMDKTHEIRIQSGALVSRSEGDRTLSYDSEGRTTRDRSVLVSDHGITVDRDYRVGSYNDLGRPSAERTVTFQSGVDAKGNRVYRIRTESNKSAMLYDGNGRLIHSVDSVVSSDRPAVTVTTTWDANGFNGNNQLIGSREGKEEVNPAGTHLTETNQTGIRYDLKGRTTNYKNTSTNSADALTETLDWSALGFTEAGQTVGINEIRRRSSADGVSYDVTTTTRKEGMGYDLSGNLTKYTQLTLGTDTPDLVSNITWTGGYDSLNRMVTFNETTHNTDKATEGKVLNVTLVTDRNTTSYDSLNHVVGYGQVMTDANGNDNTVSWAGAYDGRGLVGSYEEQTTDARGNLTVKGQSGMTYDEASRVALFVQTETSPLGVVTVTDRSATGYNEAGLVEAMSELMTETQPDGAKTVTGSSKSLMVYDSNGHLQSSHDDATVSNFDNRGGLVRERTRSQDWTEGAYNGLGQLLSSAQSTVTEGAGGAFSLTGTTVLSGSTYNILGQQEGLHQAETQVGSSVESLVLPSTWGLLKAAQKIKWLKNLTFVLEGSRVGFDELGVSAPQVGDTFVAWSELSEEEQIDLLNEGRAIVGGQAFDLATAKIVGTVDTAQNYTQSETGYNSYGETSHYTRVGNENGVGFTNVWTANGFDNFGRVTADTQVMSRGGQGVVTTDRSAIQFDRNSRAVQHNEQVLNSATAGLVSDSVVFTDYDALNRQTYNERVTLQTDIRGGAELSTMGTQIQEGTAFDEFDRAAYYDEIQFGGDSIQLDGESYQWKELSSTQKAALVDQSLAPTDQVIKMATVAGIVYNEKSLQKAMVETGLSIGQKSTSNLSPLPNAPPVAVASVSDVPAAAAPVSLPEPSLTEVPLSNTTNQANLTALTRWLTVLHGRVSGALAQVVSNINAWATRVLGGGDETETARPDDLSADSLADQVLMPSDTGNIVWTDFVKSVAKTVGTLAGLLSGTDNTLFAVVGDTVTDLLRRAWGESVLPGPEVLALDLIAVSPLSGVSADAGLHNLPAGANLFVEETRLVRSNMLYDAFNRVSSYLDVLFNLADRSLLVRTKVHDIDYNAVGQQVKTISDIHRLGLDFDETQTITRDGMVYNDLGQMAAQREVTLQNGLTLTTWTSDMKYDTGGRMTDSTSVVHKAGEEIRIIFKKDGLVLSAQQLASLLDLNPGKSLGDLVADKMIDRETGTATVDQTIISETHNVTYDSLNRVASSEETTYYGDGSFTKTHLKEVIYDVNGKRVGTRTEVTQGGSMVTRQFLLDGVGIEALALKDALQAESNRTGLSASRVMWDWFGSGRLMESDIRVNLSKVSDIFRTNIRYNTNGQMVHYEDRSSDADRGIEGQRTLVDLVYNRKGQILEQASQSTTEMEDGALTESNDLQTFRYDDATGLLLGAETVGDSRSYPAKVWSDLVDSKGEKGQDGVVDTLVSGPVSTGRTRQVHGAKNGQLDMLFQETLQNSPGTEVPGLTRNTTFSTTFFKTDEFGRSLSGFSVADSLSDDGYGNLTTGQTYQLMASVNGEIKVTLALGDNLTQTLEGSTSRTVLGTVYGYREDGQVASASGEGYTVGTDSAISDPEHIWHDGWLAPKVVTKKYADGSTRRETSQRFVDGHQEIQVVTTSPTGDETTSTTTIAVDGSSRTVHGDGTVEKKSASVTIDGREGIMLTITDFLGEQSSLFTVINDDGSVFTVKTEADGTVEERTTRSLSNGTQAVEGKRTSPNGEVTEWVSSSIPEEGVELVSKVTEFEEGADVGLLPNGQVDPGEMEWVDSNGDGLETPPQTVLTGWNSGTISQSYVVIGREAKLATSFSTTVLRSESGSVTDQVIQTDYRYDDLGRLLGATGKGEFFTTTKGYTDGVADPIPTGIVVGTIDQDYVVLQGQAKMSFSMNRSTTYSGYTELGMTDSPLNMLGSLEVPTDAVSVVTGNSWTRNFYNANGSLSRMTGGGDSRGLSWHTDGTESLSDSQTGNTYRIENGKGLMTGTTSDSKTYAGYIEKDAKGTPRDAKNITEQTTDFVYAYDGTGRTLGASGVGTGKTTALVLKAIDKNGDGHVDELDLFDTNEAGEVVEGGLHRYEEMKSISTFGNETEFVVILGQAQQKEIRSWSTAYAGYDSLGSDGLPVNPATITTSLSVMTNMFDDHGLVTGAVRNGEGKTTNRVHQIRDVNGDGDLDENDRVDFDGNGKVDPTEGYLYDEVESLSFSESHDTFIMVLGQAQVSRSQSRSVDYSQLSALNSDGRPLGAKTITTNNSTVDYSYDTWGRLSAAVGSGTGATESLVRQVVDQDGDGFISGTDLMDTNGDDDVDGEDSYATEDDDALSLNKVTNVYAILGGQAVVTQVTNVSTSYGGYADTDGAGIPLNARSVTDSTSEVNYTHNQQGQLVSATGSVNGSSENRVVQAVDINGDGLITEADRQDTNDIPGIDDGDGYRTEELVLHNTNSGQNYYIIMGGQAQVISSFTKSVENLGSRINAEGKTVPASVTTTNSITRFTYDTKGRVSGAVGESYGDTRESVMSVVDTNGDGEINLLDRVDSNEDNEVNDQDEYAYEPVESLSFFTSQTVNGVLWGQTIALRTESESTNYSGFSTLEDGVPSDAASRTTSKSTTDFICNALGQLSGARGTNSSTSYGLVMQIVDQNGDSLINLQDRVDTNGSGDVDSLDGYQSVGVYGITTSQGNTSFAVLQGVAQALVARTESTSYSGYDELDEQGIPVNAVTETTTNNRTDYVYSKEGILMAALGTSSGTTALAVQSTVDMNGDGEINEDDLDYKDSDFQSNESYGVLAGRLTSLKVFTEFTSEDKHVHVGGFDRIATHTTHSKSQSGFAPDGKGNLVPTVETQTESVVNYDYTTGGVLVDANGTDNTMTTTTHTDGSQTMARSQTVNSYFIISGEAKVAKAVTTTTSYSGFTSVHPTSGIPQNPTTVSSSVSTVQYTYENGVLIGATGGSESNTTVTNADGTQALTFSKTVNTYLVIWGQALVDVSVSTSETYSGHTSLDENGVPVDAIHYSENTTTVDNDYNNVGQLVFASGQSVGTNWDKVLTQVDTNGDGDLDEKDDSTKQVSHTMYGKSSGTLVYAVLWGQPVLVKNETNSYATDSEYKAYSVGQMNFNHTHSIVHYSFNMGGQMAHAWGESQTRSTSLVKTVKRDADGSILGDGGRPGYLDDGDQWEYGEERQNTYTVAKNAYKIIAGEAQIAESYSASWAATVINGVFSKISDSKAHGYSKNETWTSYTYNDVGQLLSATGRTAGEQTNQVLTDKDGDGRVEAVTSQYSTFAGVNTYAVVWGQAQVVKSVTSTWAAERTDSGVFEKIENPNRHGYTFSQTTVDYTFNPQGQMTGARGRTTSRQANEVLTPVMKSVNVQRKDAFDRLMVDENGEAVMDAELVKDTSVPVQRTIQTTWSTTENTYAVILGQAQVVKSVTTSDAVKDGEIIKPTEDRYSNSVTTVNYTFNADGKLTGATGWTTSRQANVVLTPGMKTTNVQRKDAFGNLMEDEDGNPVMDAVQTVDASVEATPTLQTTWSDTVNTYAVIMGQAQVIRSVTTSDAVKDGNRIEPTENGHSHSLTTVDYAFNALGQLTGAKGWTRSQQANEVLTPKTKTITVQRKDAHENAMVDENGDAVMEAVQIVDRDVAATPTLQTTWSNTENTYGVILGQAQVITSVTTSDAIRDGRILQSTEDRYSHSVTTVNYTFNAQGQLTGASGWTTSKQANEVLTPAMKTTMVQRKDAHEN